ncbi:unnamed protein product [Cylicocyclus nassatus]|uniref:Uncharacterized protein n=1 Tax=Cylicocyclus nassatus TaxID=53992 RepID=A0AA36GWZ9_CYLNA|nr:unnamed protein product [Cylicocyclus nassatus]
MKANCLLAFMAFFGESYCQLSEHLKEQTSGVKCLGNFSHVGENLPVFEAYSCQRENDLIIDEPGNGTCPEDVKRFENEVLPLNCVEETLDNTVRNGIPSSADSIPSEKASSDEDTNALNDSESSDGASDVSEQDSQVDPDGDPEDDFSLDGAIE